MTQSRFAESDVYLLCTLPCRLFPPAMKPRKSPQIQNIQSIPKCKGTLLMASVLRLCVYCGCANNKQHRNLYSWCSKNRPVWDLYGLMQTFLPLQPCRTLNPQAEDAWKALSRLKHQGTPQPRAFSIHDLPICNE